MSTAAEGSRPNRGRTPLRPSNVAALLDRVSPPDGLSWRDYLVQLLRIAASIEHALMVQYLFAAYSLAPEKGRDNTNEQLTIANCQNLLLSVAKEEMGHLLTVQNVLCLLRAPIELTRKHPLDGGFSPFPFKLERLTMDSLDRYTLAEMPAKLPSPRNNLWLELYEKATAYQDSLPKDSGAPHVGDLYQAIVKIIADPKRIPDSAFDDDSFRFQASWDDWGRSYNYKTATHDKQSLFNFFKLTLEMGDEPRRVDILIERVATRSQARDALIRVSEQGEAAPTAFKGSHFSRFFSIRKAFERLKKDNGIDWEPTYPIVDNPHTLLPNERRSPGKSTITNARSKKWADLFDLRYHMLLTYLSHSFYFAGDNEQAKLLGAIIHKTFGEMYNLKAIAGILVQLPLKARSRVHNAGPPFRLPKTAALPKQTVARWRLHRNLLNKAIKLNDSLLKSKPSAGPQEAAYLQAARELDRNSAEWIKHVIAGLHSS
jgi:hypothetical protein